MEGVDRMADRSKLEKIKDNCSSANIVAIWLMVIVGLFALVYFVYLAVAIFTPAENFFVRVVNGSLKLSTEPGSWAAGHSISAQFAPQNVELMKYSAKGLQIYNLIMTIICALAPMMYSLLTGAKMFRRISLTGKIFTTENSKTLKVIAILLVSFGVFYRAIYTLFSHIFVFGFDKFSYNISPNFSALIAAGLLFIFIQIFDYAGELEEKVV